MGGQVGWHVAIRHRSANVCGGEKARYRNASASIATAGEMSCEIFPKQNTITGLRRDLEDSRVDECDKSR